MRVEMVFHAALQWKTRNKVCNVLEKYGFSVQIEQTYETVPIKCTRKTLNCLYEDVSEVTRSLKLYTRR